MKILIVGLGSIGQRHLRNLRRSFGNKIDISAYRAVGRNLKISDNMTSEADIDLESDYNIKTYTDYDLALKDGPDAVIICNPTRLHVPVALKAAINGVNLFFEKPVSDSPAEIGKLSRIVKEKGLITFVGFQLRFNPCLKLIKDLLLKNRIGQVVTAYSEFGEYLPAAHPYEDYRNGYAARKDLGGGALLSLIHELDYLQWLFGMPNRVFAIGGKISALEMDADDSDSILMEHYISGRKVPVYVHLDFIQRPPSRKCVITGEQGKIIWDYYSSTVELRLADGGNEIFCFDNFNRNDMFKEEMEYFINCLSRSQKAEIDLEEGLKSLRIVFGARQSIETGEVVKVQDLVI